MNLKIRSFLSLCYLMLLSVVLSSCYEVEKSTVNDLQKKDVKEDFVFIADPTLMPLITRSSSGNELVGFEIDLIKEIAKREGFTVKTRAYIKNNILSTLTTGDSDIVGGGLYIDEKSKRVLYTKPYLTTGQSLLVKKGNRKIKSINDFNNHKIAAKADSMSGNILSSMNEDEEWTNVFTDSIFLAVKELANDNVDAVLLDSPFAVYYKQKKEYNLELIHLPSIKREKFGFAVNKNKKDLQKRLNSGLEKIMQDGTYREIHLKWFKSEPVW